MPGGFGATPRLRLYNPPPAARPHPGRPAVGGGIRGGVGRGQQAVGGGGGEGGAGGAVAGKGGGAPVGPAGTAVEGLQDAAAVIAVAGEVALAGARIQDLRV